jgi:hypothetical protein
MKAMLPKSLWIRYPLAIVVAFVVSAGTAFLYAWFEFLIHMTSDSYPVLSVVSAWTFNLLVGFSGVFAGAFCFQERGRVLGGAVLVVLGLSFGILIFSRAHGEFHFPVGAISTGIGGLLAVAFHWLRTPANNSLQATTAAPSSCD